jgi:hypothetical protein
MQLPEWPAEQQPGQGCVVRSAFHRAVLLMLLEIVCGSSNAQQQGAVSALSSSSCGTILEALCWGALAAARVLGSHSNVQAIITAVQAAAAGSRQCLKQLLCSTPAHVAVLMHIS